MDKIFVSYNPNVPSEQSLALRLQTLGSLYGLMISLPDRIGTLQLKNTTKQRIENSALFIVFSTKNLSKSVRDEIDFARELRKKIIVIYDKDVQKNLDLKDVIEIEYDHREGNPDVLIKDILRHIKSPKSTRKSKETETINMDALSAILLVGLGLLLLAAFTSGKK